MILGLIFLALFSGCSWWVANFNTVAFDFGTTVLIQRTIPLWADEFLSLFSLLGSFEVTTVILLVLLLKQKKLWQGLLIMGAYLYGMAIEIFGKLLIFHPNPPLNFFRYDLEFVFPSSGVQTGNSFPSGHSYRSMFLLVLIMTLLFRSKISNKKKVVLGAFSVLVVAIMLVSRVSLGEHWISDVIGGALLGAGLSSLSTASLNRNSSSWLLPSKHNRQ